MAIYIEMPKLSDTMTEGTVVKWRKNEGDKVETGDVIAEIETDKATMEMEAFDDGILHKHLIAAGGKAPVGGKIGLLLQKGEKPPAEGAPVPESPKPKAAKEETAAPEAASRASASKATSAPAPTPAAKTGERVKASPLAKKIAKEKGVELSGLAGTGPGGRVVAKDVEGAPAGGASAGKASAATPVAAMPAGAGDQKIALSGMRRVIAERLLTSKTTIPHFYLNIEVDAGPLMKFRAEANAASETAGGPKFTVNDFVLKAVIAAAQKVPAVNASFAGDSIIQYANIQLSVAVAVEEGLVTPVIREAQKKSLREISEAVKDLATRARSKKLKPDEYAGGTITVSNLGSYGIESFSAIINPPQSLIISVGAIVKKPVVNAKDEIVAGQRMAIGLSADHRVVDGAVGAQYLAELRKLVESPYLLLL
ncbi:catalytic domain of component of various dehydrogenase complexes [Chthoniobacter flavus Ellin428]|uniref:Acetyltransferase component of pyruvate dehydrogenase complex n=1 Tax=Chthoniobacter flavus Ellin428 TaxID=497964 RepID=B4CTW7_9BACT|nr:pyruvate dehydrogenase complex dihydrolipoamide acetyltransferase [Chthoniobacter flavus]EDY22005.1 catalytic domain of component of various dehydrogenase complexes [Chthoniobacter flavus Ellin428]TCO89392.1 pyruvate dehydrogenase E2 component (dihydrolipoamide acetyltransferase) [Chthoniobacter flavus]